MAAIRPSLFVKWNLFPLTLIWAATECESHAVVGKAADLASSLSTGVPGLVKSLPFRVGWTH